MNTDDYEGHTPGPWCLQWGPNETITGISELGGETIDGARDGHEPATTNTRLIADAPDLLAAYKRLREMLDAIADTGGSCPECGWGGALLFEDGENANEWVKRGLRLVDAGVYTSEQFAENEEENFRIAFEMEDPLVESDDE